MPPSFRDLKRKMRRDRHAVMLVPALYYPDDTATPLPVTVRLHLRFKGSVAGALPGGGEDSIYARMTEPEDRIVFRVAELPTGKPRNNAIVSVDVNEAYRVEAVDPTDDDEVHAKVSRIPASDPVLAGLAVPE